MNYFFAKNRIILSRILVILLVIFILISKPVVHDILIRVILIYLGTTLIFIGIMGRVFASIFMGSQRNVKIVTTGLYSITRNPLYLFSFVSTVGIILIYGSIILIVVITSVYLIYYKYVISFEEYDLTRNFGKIYSDYLNSSVPRFFPKFPLWKYGNEAVINPKVIFKTIIDTYWFVVIALFLLLWLYLQHRFNIPYLIDLY